MPTHARLPTSPARNVTPRGSTSRSPNVAASRPTPGAAEMGDDRWRAWGPVTTEGEAATIIDALRIAGVPTRSAGIVPLRRVVGIEPAPLARWVLGRAGRDALRAALVSLPFVVAVYVGLFWLRLDETSSLAIGIGLVSALGAMPIAALVGFARGWAQWSPLTVLDDVLPVAAGFLVIASNVPRSARDAIRDVAPPFAGGR